jgi:hypothetical protein
MRLQFLGSGDALGSGGRFNTCILVESETGAFLIDCGASSLIAMRRFWRANHHGASRPACKDDGRGLAARCRRDRPGRQLTHFETAPSGLLGRIKMRRRDGHVHQRTDF